MALTETKRTYQVIVGNVGTVFSGDNEQQARKFYRHYVSISKSGVGRASNEPVTLIYGDEIEDEYEGPRCRFCNEPIYESVIHGVNGSIKQLFTRSTNDGRCVKAQWGNHVKG